MFCDVLYQALMHIFGILRVVFVQDPGLSFIEKAPE